MGREAAIMALLLALPGGFANAAPEEDAVRTILARPLFAPSRRPDASAVPSESMPVLTGIVRDGAERVAMFRPGRGTGGANGGAARAAQAARPGGTVAGWRVEAIEASSVVVTRDGRRMVLHPDYAHRAPAP